MRAWLLYPLLPLAVATAFADVTGVVSNDAGKPIADAFVRFVDATDSSREVQAVTNAQGRYTLTLPPGSGTFLRGLAASNGNRAGLTQGFFYDLRGRSLGYLRGYHGFPVPGLAVSRPVDATGLPGYAIADQAPASRKSSAALSFHVSVWGKGILPYRAASVALEATAVKDFKLAATDLWDSTRAILRDDMGHCAGHFRGAKQGRVAFLGGSITYNGGWRDSVANYLKKKFPGTVFEFINAGIPSVGSDMHGFRLRRDVLEKGKVDLLFFESAVNDTTNKVASLVRTRAYEGIVRQARRANPEMDIVFYYFADASFYENVKAGKPVAPIADYEKVANPYGIPSLNLAQYVAERYTWAEFGGDVHPGAFGQSIYARNMIRMLDAAFALTVTAAPVAHIPALPLDSLCFQQGHTDSISKGKIVTGWKRVESWTPTAGGTRDGFFKLPVLESTAPGDTLTYAFTGTAVGIVVPAGPDVGMLEYAIDGKVMGTQDQFTPWSSGLNIPWTYIFSKDLAKGAHELRLVTAPGKNAQSTGHACRIIRFVVNGPG